MDDQIETPVDTLYVVLYLDDSTGKEKISPPMGHMEANERASAMTHRPGITVLSVVEKDYGQQRTNTEPNTRVWYSSRPDLVGIYSHLMTYAQAGLYSDALREKGYLVHGLVTQEEFLERNLAREAGPQDQEENQAEEPADTNEALRAAVERMEKVITRKDESRAVDAPETSRQSESRRHQALQWALNLAEIRTTRKADHVLAEHVIQEAKLFERYLKGETPGTPKRST